MTLTVPKALLDVAGRPFVDWQLERLAACGVHDVVLCVAHLGEAIRDHVGDGSRFGVRVAWSHEGPRLLGTAGALRAALPLLEPTFLVTYGDSYLPFDYADPLRMLAAHEDCDGVMAIYGNQVTLLWTTSTTAPLRCAARKSANCPREKPTASTRCRVVSRRGSACERA
jgi:NDP-sugar pyrophosphorylase family protein